MAVISPDRVSVIADESKYRHLIGPCANTGSLPALILALSLTDMPRALATR